MSVILLKRRTKRDPRPAEERFQAMRELCEELGGLFLPDFPDHPHFKQGYTISFTGPLKRPND